MHLENYKIPPSLYIPPDAMEIYLECFNGPLDLLLYLIRQKNLAISEISLKKITDQYLTYIENINHLKFELIADYLLMAAVLAEIKSRELLPKNKEDSLDDQKETLLENLRQYALIKRLSEQVEQLPRLGRDRFDCQVKANFQIKKQKLNYSLIKTDELKKAFEDLIIRAEQMKKYSIEFESISISEKTAQIIDYLTKNKGNYIRFEQLIQPKQGKLGIVVQILSLLELVKEGLIDLKQQDEQIYAKSI